MVGLVNIQQVPCQFLAKANVIQLFGSWSIFSLPGPILAAFGCMQSSSVLYWHTNNCWQDFPIDSSMPSDDWWQEFLANIILRLTFIQSMTKKIWPCWPANNEHCSCWTQTKPTIHPHTQNKAIVHTVSHGVVRACLQSTLITSNCLLEHSHSLDTPKHLLHNQSFTTSKAISYCHSHKTYLVHIPLIKMCISKRWLKLNSFLQYF